jgi:hypothetical protein
MLLAALKYMLVTCCMGGQRAFGQPAPPNVDRGSSQTVPHKAPTGETHVNGCRCAPATCADYIDHALHADLGARPDLVALGGLHDVDALQLRRRIRQ